MENNNMIYRTMTKKHYNHCKAIADELAKIAEGNCYKCPMCDEIFEYDIEAYNESTKEYTCPHCGAISDVTEIEEYSLFNYFNDCLDITYYVDADKQYEGARICIAYGGPSIYIDTYEGKVKLYWWNEYAEADLWSDDCTAIDSIFMEIYNC